MATQDTSSPTYPDEPATGTLEVEVYWEAEGRVGVVQPAAIEVAGLLMGLEEAYEALASALGYPPHFLRVTTIRNPELKLGLEGGKEAIEAIRELLYAVPSLVANLFRPKAAWRRAQLEEQVRTKELAARGASADAQKAEAEADTAQALARKLQAETEVAELQRLRTEVQAIPVRVDETAHAVLNDIVAAVARGAPDRRVAFLGDTARYIVAARAFDAKAHIYLVPAASPTAADESVPVAQQSTGRKRGSARISGADV